MGLIFECVLAVLIKPWLVSVLKKSCYIFFDQVFNFLVVFLLHINGYLNERIFLLFIVVPLVHSFFIIILAPKAWMSLQLVA